MGKGRMIKHKVNAAFLMIMIGATLSALGGTAQANGCPTHRHKAAVAFYQQSTHSNARAVSQPANIRYHQLNEGNSTPYELPNRPGFDSYLR
jgi:hypothetical protein